MLIDRAPQNLPVPLGGTAPVRVRRPARRHLVRRHAGTAGVVIGAVAAAAGLTLLLLPSTVDAYMDGAGIHVGAMTLKATGPGGVSGITTYGGDASYVLSEGGGGTAHAVAAWNANGVVHQATCSLRTDARQLVEECTFDNSAGVLTSVDTLDLARSAPWQRTYSDGVQVTIGVNPNGAVVPVPFPIGH